MRIMPEGFGEEAAVQEILNYASGLSRQAERLVHLAGTLLLEWEKAGCPGGDPPVGQIVRTRPIPNWVAWELVNACAFVGSMYRFVDPEGPSDEDGAVARGIATSIFALCQELAFFHANHMHKVEDETPPKDPSQCN